MIESTDSIQPSSPINPTIATKGRARAGKAVGGPGAVDGPDLGRGAGARGLGGRAPGYVS